MQNTVRAFQYRRGEHLPYRYVDISHAVFKYGLLLWIRKPVKLHLHIRLIAASAFDVYIFALVEGIDERLLDFGVQGGIQRIDSDNFIEDLFILPADLRHRICDDSKAPLFAFDIRIRNLSGTAVIEQRQLFLLFRKPDCRIFLLR